MAWTVPLELRPQDAPERDEQITRDCLAAVSGGAQELAFKFGSEAGGHCSVGQNAASNQFR